MRKNFNMQLNSTRRVRPGFFFPMLLLALVQLGAADLAPAQTGAPLQLTLSQAIDLALSQNRDLKMAQLSVVESQHKKEIARAAYFPQIKNESAVLHITDLAGVAVPAGAFGSPPSTGPIPAHSLVLDQGGLTSYTSGTGLAQPITQWFKIHESNRAASADINSAEIQVEQTGNDIALKVRQLYFGILIAQLRQQAAEEEVKAAEVKLAESTDSVEKGRVLEVVALESRAAVLDARQTNLAQSLQVRDLTLDLNDLLGLPLSTRLRLDQDTNVGSIAIPSREDCMRIARQQSPGIRAAIQSLEKARAGLAASRDAYIPDITGLARYSYQSGIPFLVHNFGTFGFNLTYDLFDGGRRSAEIEESRTVLSQAQLNLTDIQEKVTVQVETAYDKVEQLQDMVGVADQLLKVRVEAARLADRQIEQNAALPSARAEAHARAIAAKASLLEANVGLSLAQGDVKRTIGQIPR